MCVGGTELEREREKEKKRDYPIKSQSFYLNIKFLASAFELKISAINGEPPINYTNMDIIRLSAYCYILQYLCKKLLTIYKEIAHVNLSAV